jgi:thioesterase domain-containing protein
MEIAEMAASYVAEVRALQPEGPYALGGFSSGGVIAFEMAQQLHAAGQQVSLLALLDSWLPTPPASGSTSAAPSLRDLTTHLKSWVVGARELTAPQRRDLVQIKLRMARARLKHALGMDRGNLDAASVGALADLFGFSPEQRRIALVIFRALHRYQPRPYPGPVVLFRARMQPFANARRADSGWGLVAAGGVEVHPVGSNHLGMMQEPHVRDLALQLRRCLARRDKP